MSAFDIISFIGWDEIATAHLRVLAAAGLSASKIAACLPGTTRNAIIGKALRMKIRIGRGEVMERRIARQREDKDRVAERRIRRGRETQQRTLRGPQPPTPLPQMNARQRIEMDEPADIRLPATDDFAAVLRRESGVTFEDHAASMCKWPIGDPREASFRFCAETRKGEKSYCAHHCGIAYVSSQQAQYSSWAGAAK